MDRVALKFVIRCCLCAVVVPVVLPANVMAQGRDDRWNDRRPVYQRRASEWKDDYGHRRHYQRRPTYVTPEVNAGWFQRPYPYHLDYYKMRYGGSYAPYFGNLYGPPQVVTAPPYYGPYYGGFDSAPPNGYGPPGEYPGYDEPRYEAPIEERALPPNSGPPSNGNGLRTP